MKGIFVCYVKFKRRTIKLLNGITLAKQQQEIHDNALTWWKDYHGGQTPYDYITIGGYAGTGKTTLAGFITHNIRKEKDIKIAYCAYTGKASSVLYKKLKSAHALGGDDYVGTIHSLIYIPEIDHETGDIIGWIKNSSIEYDLIFVDEGSMVGKDIWNDLKSYGIPIIVLGDHGQLPPVGEDSFNLVKEPDFVLTEVHRQALDNPIIKLSILARKGYEIRNGVYGNGIAKIPWHSETMRKMWQKVDGNDQNLLMLCGRNKTRVSLNKLIRRKMQMTSLLPTKGERVICLRNNKIIDLMNGNMGIVQEIIPMDEVSIIKLYSEDTIGNKHISCVMTNDSFNKENNNDLLKKISNRGYVASIGDMLGYEIEMINIFDYGYCISVHKSQGSESPKVMLFDERTSYQEEEDYDRWLYTGITRAKEKLVIIDGYRS